mmetsp:Transcript_11313/g.26026  ORF Transcript_11313/g.26026 Transcript_11313/m.26026 type:complete len:342 (+) Transcript_11313:97-1122(+)
MAAVAAAAAGAQILLLPPGASSLDLATPARCGSSMLSSVSPSNHTGGHSRAPALHLSQLKDGRVVLGESRLDAASVAWSTSSRLPMENARTCPVSSSSVAQLSKRHPFVRLAVAVVVTDRWRRVLLTRRCRHMRTFPRAWVCPGGGVDAGEGLLVAAAREVKEEVGLDVEPESMAPLVLWESVFPTTPQACVEEGQIRGHHLVLFLVAHLNEKPEIGSAVALKLQEEETDAAVWLPTESVRQALEESPMIADEQGPATLSSSVSSTSAQSHKLMLADGTQQEEVSVMDMLQIYPSPDGLLNGCGEGHLCALREYGRQFDGEKMEEEPKATLLTDDGTSSAL